MQQKTLDPNTGLETRPELLPQVERIKRMLSATPDPPDANIPISDKASPSSRKGPQYDGHPGFKAVQGKIQGEGYSPAAAGAILASKTRGASKAAKKANPKLNKVKG